MPHRSSVAAILIATTASAQGPTAADLTALVFAPADSPTRAAAMARLGGARLRDLDRAAFAALERAVREAGDFAAADEVAREFEVAPPDGPALPVRMHVPPGYDPRRATPLVLAFGGGPIPRGERGDRAALAQARMMRRVWREAADARGWLVAAVVDTISRAAPGIRYETVRPRHLEAVLREVRRRYHVDEDRTLMTGISLGSNYALQCGAAAPELFCGAVPVATEGEARRDVLRNLTAYPLYVLVGSRDRNIRSIDLPRALHAILDELQIDHVYEEDAGRGHEGFAHRYDAALAWFAARPRQFWARRVVRVPHRAIHAARRQRYWIAADTRQATFAAQVVGNTIHIEAAALGELTLWLSDHLVDLDQPVEVLVNGRTLFRDRVARDGALALRTAAARGDRRALPACQLELRVPLELVAGEGALAFADRLRGKPVPSERVPDREHYAWRHLRETRGPLGLGGMAEPLPDGHLGLRVTAVKAGSAAARAGVHPGDAIVAVDDNPFFPGDDIGALLGLWWRRDELPSEFDLRVVRDAAPLRLRLSR